MTLSDILIKILLFMTVFYGGIVIAAFIGKKIREKNEKKNDDTNNKEDKE